MFISGLYIKVPFQKIMSICIVSILPRSVLGFLYDNRVEAKSCE